MIKKILIFLLLINICLSENINFQDLFNEFGISLFKKINVENNSDFMISPISISYSLMMVNSGASGLTSQDIISALNLNQVNIDSVFSSIKSESNNLNKNFSINNAIWIQSDKCYKPNLNYVSFVNSVFNGEMSYVNFYNHRLSVIEDINSWINKASLGTIKDIVSKEDIKKTTTQVLLNSVYFKGQWQIPFDSVDTKLKNFYSNSSISKIFMMNKKNRFFHYKNSKFHLLEIPYEGNQISMLIFLPSKKINIDSFIEDFNNVALLESIDSLRYEYGDIIIPKFRLEFSVSLKDYLIDMGMDVPFNPKEANFDKFWSYDNICKKNPPRNYIDVIKHKTYIEVDEQGTEASAATAIIISRITSIRPMEPFVFNANRPFLYAIYNKTNKSIMFLGKYSG